MKTELSTLQLVGIIMSLAGLLLSNSIFFYSAYIIKNKLNENARKLAIFRPFNIYFQLRKLVKGSPKGSKSRLYEKILLFLNWSLICSLVLIIVGMFLVVLG